MAVIEYTKTNVYAKTLAAKIQMDRTSTAVRLRSILLDGDHEDMLKLANSFRGHPMLEEVEFKDVVCMKGTLHLVFQMILVSVGQLKVFRVDGVPISRAVIMAVPYSPSLTQLSLVNSKLSDAEASALSLALVNHPTVEAVDLSGNDISDIGIVAFSRVMDKNLSIVTLRLDGNGKVSMQKRVDVEGKLLEHILARAA